MEVEEAVRLLLSCTGDDSMREGLRDTPMRVAKAFGEWYSGYGRDPSDLFKAFEDGATEGCDEMVLVANIPVFSNCEHHMTPFFGFAHVAYVPKKRILGLSKFARLVEVFARRLQVQERLTNQVADCIVDNLQPLGVGVLLECRHMCIESRGIKARGTITTTSALRGVLRTDPSARSEFFSLVQSASKAAGGI